MRLPRRGMKSASVHDLGSKHAQQNHAGTHDGEDDAQPKGDKGDACTTLFASGATHRRLCCAGPLSGRVDLCRSMLRRE